jgi:hypothetical protein
MNLKHIVVRGALALITALACSTHAAEAENAPQRALVEQHGKENQECGEAEFSIAAAFLIQPKLLPRSEENSIADDSACKPWPGKEPYTLAVFAYNGKVEYEKPMLIALLDVGHGKVVASLKGVFIKDASVAYTNALRFDTACYQLQPDLRAFAIDVATHSPRYAEGGVGPIRTLYVREGTKIRQVSNEIWMGEWHQVEDEMPKPVNADEDPPNREIVSTTYTIGIARTASHGYADLLITGKSTDPRQGTTTTLLHYDGKTYPSMQ